MNESRYKGQLSKIDVINKRCQIIRENINSINGRIYW